MQNRPTTLAEIHILSPLRFNGNSDSGDEKNCERSKEVEVSGRVGAASSNFTQWK